MAVTQIPEQMRAYLPRYVFKVVGSIILVATLLIAIIVTCLVLMHIFIVTSVMSWIGVVAVLVIITASVLMTALFVGRPGRDLLSAVIHISGEPTDTPLPSPADTKYAGTGFQSALQTIYELASQTNATSLEKVDTISIDIVKSIDSALDQTSTGFVIMGHDHSILYTNRATPIQIDQSGKKSLGLLFNGWDTLDTWLEECEKESVHAEHIWTRIPDKLPEEENRRLFDVIASYDKGTQAETVLTLIDRTSTYSVSEQELDFIAFAAHELRGPITVIRGYLDVLEDELSSVLGDDQKELFRRLTVSANRLSGYINNILNTSRYDRRHLSIHLEEETAAHIYDTIRDDMDLRAKAQNRLLTVTIPTDLPTIAADHASISEVFGNLIDNAIKYSNEGGIITVTAKVNGDFVDVSVEDHGIGMPGNVVSNLFQKFYRSHRSRETVAGTGIGLYISKAIVESHGGSISVHSEDGQGSTFVVSLPIYATVADKLQSNNNSNSGLIAQGKGWIKNHSMYRG